MTSPFDDVKKGERYSGETSLGLIFCVMYFVFCLYFVLDTFCYVFDTFCYDFNVCVDMCCFIYVNISFIYDMCYFWHGHVYCDLLFVPFSFIYA